MTVIKRPIHISYLTSSLIEQQFLVHSIRQVEFTTYKRASLMFKEIIGHATRSCRPWSNRKLLTSSRHQPFVSLRYTAFEFRPLEFKDVTELPLLFKELVGTSRHGHATRHCRSSLSHTNSMRPWSNRKVAGQQSSPPPSSLCLAWGAKLGGGGFIDVYYHNYYLKIHGSHPKRPAWAWDPAPRCWFAPAQALNFG